MTTAEFHERLAIAYTVVAEPCSGYPITVSKVEALAWLAQSPRGRVRYNPIANRLWIGLQYWDGEPIEDPQPIPGPSGQQPES